MVVGLLLSGLLYGQQTGDETIPRGPIHWHFQLDIFLDGEKVQIPAGVGIDVGNVTDFDVSGIDAAPMHTHELDNIVHVEQLRPTNRTMTVGYFFQVWNRTFTEDCILDKCSSGEKVVKMFVNGGPSFDFASYVPRDGDLVEIVYEERDLA